MFQYIVTQAVSFILGLTGAAVLLDNSARDSRLQPRIRESMRNMIMNPHVEKSKQTLAMIQENVSKTALSLFYSYTISVYLIQHFYGSCKEFESCGSHESSTREYMRVYEIHLCVKLYVK